MSYERAKSERPNQGLMLIGLRGVGKTVLLTYLSNQASEAGHLVVEVEATENKTLAQLIVPEMRKLLLQLSVGAQVLEKSKRAMAALRNFASMFKIKIGDFEGSVQAELGLADTGDIESDLVALFQTIGEAARERQKVVALLIDEVQYLREDDFAALIMAMHKVAQKNLPIVLIGAGLPQLAGLAGRAKSYAERLFEYPSLGALSEADATNAVQIPLLKESCSISPQGMAEIFRITEGYPYYLQTWSYAVWNAAKTCPISKEVVDSVYDTVIQNLDASFFRVRFDRMTPREKDYVFAMAELGEGPYRSGQIAEHLGRKMSVLAPVRASLIKKGMLYSPAHGDTAFTVPMFEQYLMRLKSKDVAVL